MAEHRNCPNCGAPYEIGGNRCAYCGTAYFDMSIIDMDSREEFYLSIRVNGMLVTQLVRPVTCSVSVDRDDVYAYGNYGNRSFKAACVCRSVNVNTDISFEAVRDSNKELITVRKIK